MNPKFAKKFLIDYYFELVQKLKFGIYDIDNKTFDLSDDDFLGEFECTLGQVSMQMISLRIKKMSVTYIIYLKFTTVILCDWGTPKLNRIPFICFFKPQFHVYTFFAQKVLRWCPEMYFIMVTV